MPWEARECSVTGDVYEDGRAHGYGCPHHTDLGKRTQTQLVNYYPSEVNSRTAVIAAVSVASIKK